MATIGILGGNQQATAAIISQMCKEKNLRPLVHYYKLTENNVIPIVSIDENENKIPNVFILQETTKNVVRAIEHVGYEKYLIVNADSQIGPLPAAKLITYGFNGKASVTASSVADGSMQACIQRGFLTLSGRECDLQEIKAACPSDTSPINVLGAITACTVCDVL